MKTLLLVLLLTSVVFGQVRKPAMRPIFTPSLVEKLGGYQEPMYVLNAVDPASDLGRCHEVLRNIVADGQLPLRLQNVDDEALNGTVKLVTLCTLSKVPQGPQKQLSDQALNDGGLILFDLGMEAAGRSDRKLFEKYLNDFEGQYNALVTKYNALLSQANSSIAEANARLARQQQINNAFAIYNTMQNFNRPSTINLRVTDCNALPALCVGH